MSKSHSGGNPWRQEPWCVNTHRMDRERVGFLSYYDNSKV